MSKFVLAGKADCPYYARAELLADRLQRNMPDFSVEKVCQHPKDWQKWLEETCKKNNWKHERSPIVWRELVDRGGRGLLLGGFSEFLEYVQGYYGMTLDMTSELMMQIAAENMEAKEKSTEYEDYCRSLIKPIYIWITSCLDPSCYQLVPLLCEPGVFGSTDVISLHLLHVNANIQAMERLKMDLEDLTLTKLHEVNLYSSLDQAFLSANVIIFLETSVTEESEGEVAMLFQSYGWLIDAGANKDVRVIVAGNSFINLKCLLLLESAPSLNKNQIVAMATQLEKEASALIAEKLEVSATDVTNVIIWGNINGRFYVDLQIAKVFQYPGAIWGPKGFYRYVLDVLYDRKWLVSDFPGLLRTHWAAVTLHNKGAPVVSTAHGIITVLRAWTTDSEDVISLGVCSTGQLGIPKEIVFSMPVSFRGGTWTVPANVVVGEKLKTKLEVSIDQLKAERRRAFHKLKIL